MCKGNLYKVTSLRALHTAIVQSCNSYLHTVTPACSNCTDAVNTNNVLETAEALHWLYIPCGLYKCTQTRIHMILLLNKGSLVNVSAAMPPCRTNDVQSHIIKSHSTKAR